MDAKRIVPVIEIRPGAVPSPLDQARRLELEGADGILFREAEPGGDRSGWIREAAGALSIPISLEADFRGWAEVEEALAAGIDRIVLPGRSAAMDPTLAAIVETCGRARAAVAVRAALTGSDWRVALADEPEGRDALAWMAELETRGCGEILLQAEPEGEAAGLVQGAARLALAVLFRSSGDEGLAAEALLNGADGVAYPAGARSPNQWKEAMDGRGLAIRP
jgi:imidazole glycerol phosphate synthase subunit HisF